jgi:hypothetical protein
VESTTYSKSLQTLRLQDLHTAHRPPGLPAIAVLSGRTAHKLPVKISALIARIIVAHIVKEAKRSPSQHRSDSGRPLTAEMKPGIEPSDEGIRFLPREPLSPYWLESEVRKAVTAFRPSETMSVNACAFRGTNPTDRVVVRCG